MTTAVYTSDHEDAGSALHWLASHNDTFDHFINGVFQTPSGTTDRIEVINPATGERLASIPRGTQADVDAAVASASEAFKTWSQLSGFERALHLYAIARAIRENARLFAVLETLDNGKAIREARDADVPLVVRHFEHHAGRAQTLGVDHPNHKPRGVVGQVIPWNFPFLMLAWKVAVALATGNTVVIKTADSTPLTAMRFAEILMEIGLPKGVVNIVNGDGSTGDALVRHPGIAKVAFTGSTAVACKIRTATAGSGKALTLEAGGKSPFIVCEDADLDAAVEGIIDAIFFNKGEVCCAGSRAIVQESVVERFLAKLKRRMSRLRVGHPLDKTVDIGAMNSRAQFDKVTGLIALGEQEGATKWQPDSCLLESCQCGLFIPPTLFTNVSPAHTIAREEIFGPVLVIMTFREVGEAVELANNTRYGLAASVWSQTMDVAFDIASRIEAGTVWINCTNQFDAAVEFGGRRESGWGSEGGDRGMLAYLTEVDQPPVEPRVPEPEDRVPEPVVGLTLHRTRRNLIGGALKRPDGDRSYRINGPGGVFLGNVGHVNRKDLRSAVEAAAKAFLGWRGKTGHNRAQILRFFAENLTDQRLDIIERLRAQTGISFEQARQEFDASVEALFWNAAYADRNAGTVSRVCGPMLVTTLSEPIGVIGVRATDELPLLGMVAPMAQAIAQGNTVVMLAGTRPISALDLVPIAQSSDLPGGVVNILTPEAPDEAAVMLAGNYDEVGSFWYFGYDPDTSRRIEEVSIGNLKRTWVSDGRRLNWLDPSILSARALAEATHPKAIWVPFGA
ncbi:aldehyde dehydrogenase family protein [Candidatus Uhrbacteria bacterium]|nr:aldehyde dehydrogenase family protein [Candidatus Uhrbacteria bacterium]